MIQSNQSKIIWLTLFSIAMGFLETAVVIYLRKIYYPEGFEFPLAMMGADIAVTEIIREAATLLMLIAIGIFTGRTKTEKFAFFIYSFAIWDIFYYIFLKLMIAWPESLFTWDILFLIPTTWVGPVICPVLLSLSMIILAAFINHFTNKSTSVLVNKYEWIMLITGSIIVIVSFTYEYTVYLNKEFSFLQTLIPANRSDFIHYAIQFIPEKFPWIIFWFGEAIIASGIIAFWRRNTKLYQKTNNKN